MLNNIQIRSPSTTQVVKQTCNDQQPNDLNGTHPHLLWWGFASHSFLFVGWITACLKEKIHYSALQQLNLKLKCVTLCNSEHELCHKVAMKLATSFILN